MATETPLSHQPTGDKVNEEVKSMEQESVSASEKGLEEENPKSQQLPTQSESGEKHIEAPAIEVMKIVCDAPAADVPVESKMEMEKVSLPDSQTPTVLQPLADVATSEAVTEPAEESTEKEAEDQQAIAAIKNVQQEVPIENQPAPSVVLPVKETEPVVVEETEDLAVSKEAGKSEALTPEVAAKEDEPSEVNKQIEKPELVEVPPTKETESVAATKIEDLSKEVDKAGIAVPEVDVELEEPKILEQAGKPESLDSAIEMKPDEQFEVTKQVEVKSKDEETEVTIPDVGIKFVEEHKGEPSLPDVIEKTDVEDVKEEIVKAGEEKDAMIKIETENVERGISNVELALPTKVEDNSNAIANVEVTEKVLEEEKTGEAVEPVVDNKKEETPALVETKDEKVEGDLHETVSESVTETKDTDIEVNEEETAKTSDDMVEKEKDLPRDEGSSKDLPSDDMVKPAKQAQKQTSNILVKVKQSLVKVKKAITGKSPSSKVISPDAKDDIKVK